jgi:hypothetical protein
MQDDTPGMCELCCKLMNSDDEIVVVDLVPENLPSAGTRRAHRHCAALSYSLGSLSEARQLLSPRTSRQLLDRATDQKVPCEPRTITIRPARVVINTMHTGALFSAGPARNTRLA